MRTTRSALGILAAALLATSGAHASDDLPFKDAFTKAPHESWTWLREDPDGWRTRDGGLEIRVRPAKIRNAPNTLLRPAPNRDRPYRIEVTVSNDPTHQFEQLGITWHADDKPLAKLVKELINGKDHIVFTGPKGLVTKAPMDARLVRLRLTVHPDHATAAYLPHAKGEWIDAGRIPLPPAEKQHIGLQCFDGPPDAVHWARFEQFTVSPLDD